MLLCMDVYGLSAEPGHGFSRRVALGDTTGGMPASACSQHNNFWIILFALYTQDRNGHSRVERTA